ncbi:PH domain-containing protein [Microbacterium sp. LRZ72]|uniref:hypothetical protein n=1 Tax=Microbacterium sp. LRZ72 TaxID=2942481 RepID=UPI0029ACE9FD|nr:hypothetical protein [Microbacterium sp. LRZ72]MDX2375767.1 PH domain-containing protein [Microbacterium sp. LRZ72]
MPKARDTQVFRPPIATVTLFAAAVLAGFLLVDALVRAGVVEMLLLAPWVLIPLWVVYLLSYTSHIRVDAAGATVQNLLRIVRIPWAAVAEIDLGWQIGFTLHDGTVIRSFGGPSRSRPGRTRRADNGEPRVTAGERQLERMREQWRAAGAEQRTEAGGVRRSWDVPALLVGLALAVWAVAAVLIAGV